MSGVPAECVFGRDELGSALEALLRENRLGPPLWRPASPPPRAREKADEDRQALETWIFETAEAAGAEVRAVSVSATTEQDFLRRSPPAVFSTTPSEPRDAKAIVVLRARRGRVTLLTRDQRQVTVPAGSIALSALAPAMPDWTTSLLDALHIDERFRVAARSAFHDAGGPRAIGVGYVLGLPASTALSAQLRARGAGRDALGVVAASVLTTALTLGSLVVFGNAAFADRVKTSQLVGWALLLLTTIPVRLASRQAQARITLALASVLRRRLLEGALRLSLDRLRSKGVGAFLALVNESEAVERLALQIGFAAVATVVNLFGLLLFLTYARSGAVLVLVALVTLGAIAYRAWRWYGKLTVFTASRLALSDDTVAKLLGSRTRRTQQDERHWHDGEDAALTSHVRSSVEVDRAAAVLEVMPRIWTVAALVTLVPALGGGASGGPLIIAMAGILLFAGSLQALVAGVFDAGRFAIAWRSVGELVRAGRATPPAALVPHGAEEVDLPKCDGDVLVEAVRVGYAYEGSARAVASDVSLRVRRGERLLVEGPSGGGKSTLANLLAGTRAPASGLLLIDGLDQFSQSPAGWQRAVALAPQFHENHVFLNTLRFNLLLGNAWPPSASDMSRAQEIVEELGLGPVVARMPAGLFEMVGETGWRLSHGEQSRLFIARSLLQGGDVIVFDESFAALDPETLEQCFRCVFRHARTLVVIAHP
jgi:ATP-binding cassette, subfamily B, bacterial